MTAGTTHTIIHTILEIPMIVLVNNPRPNARTPKRKKASPENSFYPSALYPPLACATLSISSSVLRGATSTVLLSSSSSRSSRSRHALHGVCVCMCVIRGSRSTFFFFGRQRSEMSRSESEEGRSPTLAVGGCSSVSALLSRALCPLPSSILRARGCAEAWKGKGDFEKTVTCPLDCV